VLVPVPFDPDQVWGGKPRHHVGGTVNGMRVRGVVESHDGVRGFVLGPAWLRDCGVAVSAVVDVVVEPEGPQRIDLAEDVASALAANPHAAAFFAGALPRREGCRGDGLQRSCHPRATNATPYRGRHRGRIPLRFAQSPLAIGAPTTVRTACAAAGYRCG
jgi:hypothetical protein